MLKTKKIAIVGCGNIGSALLGGILRGKLVSPKSVTVTRRDEVALEELRRKWDVHATGDNKKAVQGADVVLLAVKPQAAADVLRGLAGAVDEKQLIISVMAGIPTEQIEKRLDKPAAIIRAMPNTPALIDQGATAIAKGVRADDSHLAIAKAIFESVGIVETVPESLMDAVTGLSGSGPVYIYMVIEALTDGGVKMGLPRPAALRLAAQTVLGAAKLVLETGKHPAILKDEVTTPGGTAIAAIHELEAKGLRNVLIDAVVTATKRSQELSKIYG